MIDLSAVLATAKFPIEQNKEYYSIGESTKIIHGVCSVCNDTATIDFKGKKYLCPECGGSSKDKPVIERQEVYFVQKWQVNAISIIFRYGTPRVEVCFERISTKNDLDNLSSIRVSDRELPSMKSAGYNSTQIYDDYKEVMKVVKQLNAEVRARAQKGEVADD